MNRAMWHTYREQGNQTDLMKIPRENISEENLNLHGNEAFNVYAVHMLHALTRIYFKYVEKALPFGCFCYCHCVFSLPLYLPHLLFSAEVGNIQLWIFALFPPLFISLFPNVFVVGVVVVALLILFLSKGIIRNYFVCFESCRSAHFALSPFLFTVYYSVVFVCVEKFFWVFSHWLSV